MNICIDHIIGYKYMISSIEVHSYKHKYNRLYRLKLLVDRKIQHPILGCIRGRIPNFECCHTKVLITLTIQIGLVPQQNLNLGRS